jgi:hypothetical protein
VPCTGRLVGGTTPYRKARSTWLALTRRDTVNSRSFNRIKHGGFARFLARNAMRCF